MKLNILTNEAHSHLGWATSRDQLRDISETLSDLGIEPSIVEVNSAEGYADQSHKFLGQLVWPNVYHVPSRKGDVSLARLIEEDGHKLIGPNSYVLENVLDKGECQLLLGRNDVPIPLGVLVTPQNIEQLTTLLQSTGHKGKYIVKPTGSSCSRGITTKSIQENPDSLAKHIHGLFSEGSYGECMIVEEYLPGPEFTVAMIGNGNNRKYFATQLGFRDGNQYNILHQDLRGALATGVVTHSPISDTESYQKIVEAAAKAFEALGVHDFGRLDGRLDSEGNPRIFDVNGMPGLSRDKSYSVHVFYALNPAEDKARTYARLLGSIVHAGAKRHEMEIPNQLERVSYLGQ